MVPEGQGQQTTKKSLRVTSYHSFCHPTAIVLFFQLSLIAIICLSEKGADRNIARSFDAQ
jgi:hypothetical protein